MAKGFLRKSGLTDNMVWLLDEFSASNLIHILLEIYKFMVFHPQAQPFTLAEIEQVYKNESKNKQKPKDLEKRYQHTAHCLAVNEKLQNVAIDFGSQFLETKKRRMVFFV